jgi:hypothetical protein
MVVISAKDKLQVENSWLALKSENVLAEAQRRRDNNIACMYQRS